MNCEMIHLVARTSGMSAGRAVKPTPMTVEGGYTVSEGLCGMAYVKIKANNKSGREFVKWLKANSIGFAAHGGGWQIPCHEFNQSFARKVAWCEAYASHLRMICDISATVIEWVN